MRICAAILAVFGLTLTGCGGNSTAVSNPLAPAISTQPAAQSVMVGQTATFSVVANGTAPLSYQWQKGTAAIAGAASASYTTPPHDAPRQSLEVPGRGVEFGRIGRQQASGPYREPGRRNQRRSHIP
ncbi:MAG TPA: hypothetical protein VNY29_02755 [Terriglobales bacterium]|nr:hypothetical protein [Terriglobales bacterium]